MRAKNAQVQRHQVVTDESARSIFGDGDGGERVPRLVGERDAKHEGSRRQRRGVQTPVGISAGERDLVIEQPSPSADGGEDDVRGACGQVVGDQYRLVPREA
eukprot:4759411-Prymnesium_polylepis.1